MSDAGATQGSSGNEPIRVPEVSVNVFARLHGTVPLVDVRMPDEYDEGHVPGAILIPLPELPDRLDEIPRDEAVYVICRSGARSHKACELLISRGFDATNVVGGTLEWIESDRPVARGPAPG